MVYAAYFDNALNMTAQYLKLPITASETSAQVGLVMKAYKSYSLYMDLSIEVSGIDDVHLHVTVV